MHKLIVTMLAMVLLTCLCASGVVAQDGQDRSHTTTPQSVPHSNTSTYPHPAVAPDPWWAGIVVIVIAGMFLSAAVIGPIVRANIPEQVVPLHSHDEHH